MSDEKPAKWRMTNEPEIDKKPAKWRGTIVWVTSILFAGAAGFVFVGMVVADEAHNPSRGWGVLPAFIIGILGLVVSLSIGLYVGFFVGFIIQMVLPQTRKERLAVAEQKRLEDDKKRKEENLHREDEDRRRKAMEEAGLRRAQEYARECAEAEAWGFTGPKAHLLSAYEKHIQTFTSRHAGRFLFEIDDLTKAQTHAAFAALVLQTFREQICDAVFQGQVSSEFTYPSSFRVVWQREATPFVQRLVPAIQSLDEATRNEARNVLHEAATQQGQPVLILVAVAQKLGWLGDLERAWRKEDRFFDVLKLLVLQSKWDAAVNWLQEHHRFVEPVFMLEKAGRFRESVDYLQKLDPIVYREFDADGRPIEWGAQQQKEAFDRKLAELKSYAAVAKQKQPALSLQEIEDMYAYGKISKKEYEQLKGQAITRATKTA